MKYIIVDNKSAIIFPAQMLHADAFDFMNPWHMLDLKVTGAGYIGADQTGKLYVYGRSEGYNIDAKPEDLEIVMGALHRPRKPM